MTGITEEARKYLEDLGVEGVRLALLTNTNLPLRDRGVAWRWLKEQDEAIAARKQRFARWNLALTTVGALAAIVAAGAGIWALLR
jgi:hypothetical protein